MTRQNPLRQALYDVNEAYERLGEQPRARDYALLWAATKMLAAIVQVNGDRNLARELRSVAMQGALMREQGRERFLATLQRVRE